MEVGRAAGLEADCLLAEGAGEIACGVVVGGSEELLRGVGEEALPARIDGFELGEVLDEHPELGAVAAEQGDAVGQAIHAAELAELIEEEGDPVFGPGGHRGDGVEREADEAAHEAQTDTQPVRRDGEIDGHRPALQLRHAEIRAAEGGAEPGIIEPGGVPHDGGENRAALAVRPVQVDRRGPRRQPVPAFRIGQHVGQGVGEIILGGGDDAAQLRH